MHTRRPRRAVGIGALLALLVTALMAGGAAVASAASATAPASGSATACALPEPTDDDTISVLGRICDRRESPQVGVEGVDVTVEDESGAVIGEATSEADGTFIVDLPGDPASLLGKSFTVKLVRGLPARGHRARRPDPHRADQPRQRPVGDLPDRRGRSRWRRQGGRGDAARRRRPGVLRAARDGRPGPVDDLRHDGADQLRPRRADHVRRDHGPGGRPAARERSPSAAPTSPSRWAWCSRS